jgi:hypothetical protein
LQQQPNFLNKNMQRLCGLPLLFTEHFLLGSILLSGWFTVQFAARLDSAMCGSSVRGKFLSLIASSSVLLIDEGGRSQCNKKGSLYYWAKTRGVKLRTLYIQNDRSGQLEEYLRIFGGSIREMVFPIAQFFTHLAYLAVNNCPGVTQLEVRYLHSAPWLIAMFFAFRGLKTFVCRANIDDIHLCAMSRFCPDLIELRVVAGTLGVLGLSRIASFPALQKLRVYTLHWAEQNRALTAIAQSCRHFVEIGLEVIPPGSIVEFAQC